jgi:UDP-N-acetylglucosamine 2-epimerase (hydrolysing)
MREVARRLVRRKLLFVTATRADFGKLRDLMLAAQRSSRLDSTVLVTGMHLLRRYGYTVNELQRAGLTPLRLVPNQIDGEPMALVLANTVSALTRLVHDERPDALIVHGDRVEALAGALVGSLSNIRVVHIEGGELSGTVDDAIRHSISKHAHVHLVANESARERLLQLGEQDGRIRVVGSPEVDVLTSTERPCLYQVQQRYTIPFRRYGVLVLHPVTTEPEANYANAAAVVDAVLAGGGNWVVIDPNNDEGCADVRVQLDRLSGPRFTRLPSMRFEYFVSLMEHAEVVLGNSSAGVREAPVLGTPSVDVGSRQRRRASAGSVLHAPPRRDQIMDAIERARAIGRGPGQLGFGQPGAGRRILALLEGEELWQIPLDKEFVDRREFADRGATVGGAVVGGTAVGVA